MENKNEFSVLLKPCSLWRRWRAKNNSKDWYNKEVFLLFLIKFSSLFYHPFYPVAVCIVNYPFSRGTLEFSWHYFTGFFGCFSFSSDRPRPSKGQCLPSALSSLLSGQPIIPRDSAVTSTLISLNSSPFSLHNLFSHRCQLPTFKFSFFLFSTEIQCGKK